MTLFKQNTLLILVVFVLMACCNHHKGREFVNECAQFETVHTSVYSYTLKGTVKSNQLILPLLPGYLLTRKAVICWKLWL